MLKDIIDNRYSAKRYNDIPVEQEKIDYIVHCATNAPSKQCVYPYELFVLGNSEKAKEIKEWAFWEESWCVKGRLSTLLTEEERQNPQKSMNGQYNAPLFLVWVERDPDEKHDTAIHAKSVRHSTYNEKKVMDIAVSASFAMLAGEEQGLNTCFAKCHNEKNLAEALGRPGRRAELGVGFGYATADNDGRHIEGDQGTQVLKDGEHFGWLPKNLDQTFPREWHHQRQFGPDVKKLIHVL